MDEVHRHLRAHTHTRTCTQMHKHKNTHTHMHACTLHKHICKHTHTTNKHTSYIHTHYNAHWYIQVPAHAVQHKHVHYRCKKTHKQTYAHSHKDTCILHTYVHMYRRIHAHDMRHAIPHTSRQQQERTAPYITQSDMIRTLSPRS